MTFFLARWIRRVGILLASLIIFCALAVNIADLLSPYLTAHRHRFEKWVLENFQRQITVDSVKINWHYLEPVLTFNHLRVLDVTTHAPTLEVQHATFDFAILKSFISRKLVLQRIWLSGADLTIQEKTAGKFSVEGLTNFSLIDNASGNVLKTNEILAWIFAEPFLELNNINIRYIPLKSADKYLSLKKINLENNGMDHIFQAQAILNQAIPVKITTRVNWRGDISDIPHISADVYFYCEGLYLPQWFSNLTWHNLQIKEGLGSAKIWGVWNNNQWQSVSTQFRLYELSVFSQLTQHVVNVSRMGGSLFWENRGDQQTLEAKQFYLDLPNYLWPVTHFKVIFKKLNNIDNFSLQNLQVGFINIDNFKMLATNLGLLPDSLLKPLFEYNLTGNVSDLDVKIPDGFDINSNNLNGITFSGKAENVSFRSVNSMPGIRNLTANIDWDGAKGNLIVNSHNIIISLRNIFKNDLQFDIVNGLVSFNKDQLGNWNFIGQSVHAQNKDLNANANFKLQKPPTAFPNINLNADFYGNNAGNISHYLPLAVFDAPLSDWLQHAFWGGQIESGHAVLQGNLHDFPFDNNKGKFIISGKIKNLDFRFAPDWPAIRHVSGTLLFSNRSMNVSISEGEIAGVPITQASGHIPYLGDAKPAVLNVQGLVQSDLAKGLVFIHKSPLEKTIGKDLQQMHLQGPMVLKLDLTVPLKTPHDTKVLGDVLMTNANLNLPLWKIDLNKLNGNFQFTDDGITAEALEGELWGKPISLNLSTDVSNPLNHIITAKFASSISTLFLEKWLKYPISKVAQGEAQYQAILKFSHNPTEIHLSSDLKGISLNLPADYKKELNEVKPLSITIFAADNEPLKVKADYNQQLSAALKLDRKNDQLSFYNGEFNIGDEANWQTLPGLLISGKVKEINWSMLSPYFDNTDASSSMLRAIDLHVDLLTAFNYTVKNLQIKVDHQQHSWVAKVTSSDITGVAEIPENFQGPIKIKADHLFLPSNQALNTQTINLKKVPAINFDCFDFHYGALDLGHVNFNIIPNDSGLAIQHFGIQSLLWNLQGDGGWLVKNNIQETHLQGKLSTPKISEMLKTLSLAYDNFDGSKADAEFKLNWQSSPFKPDLNTLSGSVYLVLGEGRIINLGESTNAKLGLGRLLNILSLQSIPRRLTLDFSDIFQKGYSFDSMKGDFILHNGNAKTTNTRINGPLARIEVEGEMGLATKDLDLLISVTPYVTSSLPVVATLAGGPVVGAATWLIDKLITHAVSKVTTYSYKVTGSWENPEWEQVK